MIADRPPRRSLCLACVGDPDLRQHLRAVAAEVTCVRCKRRKTGVSLKSLAEAVDPTLRLVLRPGETYPRYVGESDRVTFEQQGEEVTEWIQSLLVVDDVVARMLLSWLIELECFDPRDGGEPFYDEDVLYQRGGPAGEQFRRLWLQFSETLKHEQRFFGRETGEQLSKILGKRGSAEAGELPVHVVESGDGAVPLYRARRASSTEEARTFIERPEVELTAPPPARATSGRMNPAGIVVLYAALSEAVAIAEVRPSVGGLVVVGAFAAKQSLRLLDLTRIGRDVRGGVFSTNYLERKARADFLAGFHDLVTQPVQPQDEPLEHLATQAVAEWVRNELQFDGILYGSVQVGNRDIDLSDEEYAARAATSSTASEHLNVVLFGRVRRLVRSDYVAGYDRPSTSMEFPVEFAQRAARCFWVRAVSYSAHCVDVSDERGDPDGFEDLPF